MDASTRDAARDALMMAMVAVAESLADAVVQQAPDRSGMLFRAQRHLADCEDLAVLAKALEVVSRR